jgi:hypothetical protein
LEAVPFQRGQNRSVLGAFALPAADHNGMVALWHKLGAVTREEFERFLHEALLPKLERGSVLVLDNARIHHGGRIAELVAAAGCSLLYLPPYSPDFSPIELAWSWLKFQVRLLAPRDDHARQEAIQQAATQMPPHALAWFRHCGYSPH